jgi:hypothetical protein
MNLLKYQPLSGHYCGQICLENHLELSSNTTVTKHFWYGFLIKFVIIYARPDYQAPRILKLDKIRSFIFSVSDDESFKLNIKKLK